MKNETKIAASILATILAVSCTLSNATPAPDDEGEREGQAAVESEHQQAACVQAIPGSWTGDGACLGMPMTNTTTVNSCTLTFSHWDMAMSVPAGATIEGDALTFTGNGWIDCTGTISDDGTSISARCSDGCTFTMNKNK